MNKSGEEFSFVFFKLSNFPLALYELKVKPQDTLSHTSPGNLCSRDAKS
jgi:hypothetical protein